MEGFLLSARLVGRFRLPCLAVGVDAIFPRFGMVLVCGFGRKFKSSTVVNTDGDSAHGLHFSF